MSKPAQTWVAITGTRGLNEAASLPWVLEHIPSWVHEVVLVDGLSTDSTEAVAGRLRPNIWRRHLAVLELTASGFEIETELALRAVRAALVIREVPSYELERRAGLSNINAFRDGARVLRTVLGELAGHGAWGVASPISLVEVRVPSPRTVILPAVGDRRIAIGASAPCPPPTPVLSVVGGNAEADRLNSSRCASTWRGPGASGHVPRDGRGGRGFGALSFPGTIAAALTDIRFRG